MGWILARAPVISSHPGSPWLGKLRPFSRSAPRIDEVGSGAHARVSPRDRRGHEEFEEQCSAPWRIARMKREDHFRLLASVALIDGHLDETEKDRLLALARLMALRPGKALAIIKELRKGAKLSGLKIPKRRVLRLALFQDLVMLAAQDGQIARQEKAFLVKLAPHFGIELEELERLLVSSLAAVESGHSSAPLPSDDAHALPELLRDAHAARDGTERSRFALRLLRDGEPLPEEEIPLFVRLAARQRIDAAAAAALLEEPIGEAPRDPVAPRDQRDGIKAFGGVAGLLRLKDLVPGEEDLLARLAAPFGVGRVLLRQTLRVYVPASMRRE